MKRICLFSIGVLICAAVFSFAPMPAPEVAVKTTELEKAIETAKKAALPRPNREEGCYDTGAECEEAYQRTMLRLSHCNLIVAHGRMTGLGNGYFFRSCYYVEYY